MSASHRESVKKEKIALVTTGKSRTHSPPINLLSLSTILENEGYETDISPFPVLTTDLTWQFIYQILQECPDRKKRVIKYQQLRTTIGNS